MQIRLPAKITTAIFYTLFSKKTKVSSLTCFHKKKSEYVIFRIQDDCIRFMQVANLRSDRTENTTELTADVTHTNTNRNERERSLTPILLHEPTFHLRDGRLLLLLLHNLPARGKRDRLLPSATFSFSAKKFRLIYTLH